MKVYLYDPVTFEFTREGVAHPDQMVEGDFIHPANSTTLQPVDVPEGKIVKFIEGEWIESDPTPLTPEEVESLRAIEYANPTTGSDRYFLEAARKRASGDEQGAEEAEQQGLALVAEIKNKLK